MQTELDDKALVQKAKQGDSHAFGELVRYYQHSVMRTARLLTKNEEAAQDVAQEAFERAYKYLDCFKPGKPFVNWLLTITKNTAKSWLAREHKVSGRFVSLQEAGDTVLDQRTYEIYSALTIQQQVREAISELSPANRTVVHLYYICGYSYTEISNQLEIPKSTVRSRLQESRKQLREEFVSMVTALRLQKTLTKKDGLIGDTITAIFEDSKGNMWFGTTNGVSRYDGNTFQNFTQIDGLALDTVGAILEDSRGALWFGTGRWNVEGKGVSRYDGKTFQNFTTADGLVDNTVKDIFEDNEGHLWFATHGGVSRYNGENFHNIKDGFAHNARWNSNNGVDAIVQDADGNLWFGGYGGISCYNGEMFGHLTTDDGLQSGWVTDLLFDQQGNLWITRAGGGSLLARLDLKLNDQIDRGNPISKDLRTALEKNGIVLSQKAKIWSQEEGGRGIIRDGKLFDIEPKFQAEFDINIISVELRDAFGRNGFPISDPEFLFRLDLKRQCDLDSANASFPKNLRQEFEKKLNCSLLQDSTILTQEKGSLWLITELENVPNGWISGDTFTIRKEEDRLNVYRQRVSVHRTADNQWRISDEGERIKNFPRIREFFVVKEQNQLDLYQNQYEVIKGNNHLIILGRGSGISRYDGKNLVNFPSHECIPMDITESVMQDQKGNLWFTSRDGVSVYDGKIFHNFTTGDGLPHNNVSAVLEDRHGTLWFATDGGVGLGVYVSVNDSR